MKRAGSLRVRLPTRPSGHDAKWRIAPGKIKEQRPSRRRSGREHYLQRDGRQSPGRELRSRSSRRSWATSSTGRLDDIAVRLKEGTLKVKHRKGVSLNGRRASAAGVRGLPLRIGLRSRRHRGMASGHRRGSGSRPARSARKTYANVRTACTRSSVDTRHPARRYLTAHDPLAGLPKLRRSRAATAPLRAAAGRRPAPWLAAKTPPDDTIIKAALLSGLRRGELFAFARGSDVETGAVEGGVIHVRRRDLPRASSTHAEDHAESDRVVDVPHHGLLGELTRLPTLLPGDRGGGLPASAQRRDSRSTPTLWHHRRLVPIRLETAGLRLPRRAGLHSLRQHVASPCSPRRARTFTPSPRQSPGHSSTQFDPRTSTGTSSRRRARRCLCDGSTRPQLPCAWQPTHVAERGRNAG